MEFLDVDVETLTYQLSGQLAAFSVVYFVTHDLAAVDVLEQLQVIIRPRQG